MVNEFGIDSSLYSRKDLSMKVIIMEETLTSYTLIYLQDKMIIFTILLHIFSLYFTNIFHIHYISIYILYIIFIIYIQSVIIWIYYVVVYCSAINEM